MKVFYIHSGLEGCYAVRCLLPLQANGWNGDKTSLRDEIKVPESRTQAALDAEIVVFHRPDTQDKLELARLLKKQGKKIVFDNDDTFKDDGGFKFNEYMDKERLEKGLKSLNETIDTFIKEADLVTCSTQFLADEYSKITDKPIVVLPNCIDPFYYEEPERNEGDKVRIGITGSVAITADMDLVQPIVEHFHNDPRVQIVLFSMPPRKYDGVARQLYSEEYKFWDNVNVEWQSFVPNQDYYDTLNNLKLDMMIIPRADTYFNRCKSNIKFLEASMYEIPVIAQSFPTKDSPYEQDPEDSEHMILATTVEDWIEKIDKLIEDKDKRLEMGKKARAYVEGKYDINNNAPKWVEAYKKLYE